jgi:endo-1,4-beta-mannosidase
MMFDVLALALSCQLTRVVTFQFGNGGEKWYFRWLGINENSHDDIAHKDDGKNEAVTAKVLKINVWYAQQVAYLARALARLPAAEGTVLDNSLVVWGNELATGLHNLDNIPVVLLGKAAGGLKNPGRVIDSGLQDYHRLGTTLLNLMGVPATGFGESPDCGVLQGLTT